MSFEVSFADQVNILQLDLTSKFLSTLKYFTENYNGIMKITLELH